MKFNLELFNSMPLLQLNICNLLLELTCERLFVVLNNCEFVYVSTCVYVCVYMRILCICMYECIYVCMCMCLIIKYIVMYIYIYIYIHNYIALFGQFSKSVHLVCDSSGSVKVQFHLSCNAGGLEAYFGSASFRGWIAYFWSNSFMGELLIDCSFQCLSYCCYNVSDYLYI